MSTTVRIGEEDKARLQRLQAAWQAARGESPAQQELLARGLEYLERHWSEFIAEATWRPFHANEFKALARRVQGHHGGSLTDDVDAVVYDEDEA